MSADPLQAQSRGRSCHQRTGYSVLEVLIAIGIVGILVSLLLPAVQSTREASRRTQCLNNLRQIALALHTHDDVYGYLPPRKATHPHDPNEALHWTALILAQLGQQQLWSATRQACNLDPVTHHDPPHVGHSTVVREYCCPTDSRLRQPLLVEGYGVATFGSYLGVAGSPKGGSFVEDGAGGLSLHPVPGILSYYDSSGSSLAAVTDGLSQTLMVGERPPPASLEAGRWYSRYLFGGAHPGPDGVLHIPALEQLVGDPCAPSGSGFGPGRIENPCDRHHYWSLHPAGGNFAFGDGSTHFMSYDGASIMSAMATRSRGERINRH